MTMHLVGPYMTTNNYKKKRRGKITAGKMKQYETYLREYNKNMKRMGSHNLQMTMDEYIDYRQGYYKPKSEPRAIQTPWHYSGANIRETEHVPSLSSDSGIGTATKKPAMQYTGERKLVGIAMMHKSNLVPVFADEDDKTGQKQATEIAQMRRN